MDGRSVFGPARSKVAKSKDPAEEKIKGEAKLADLGAYNDPKKTGDFQYVFWVLLQGENMKDCEIKRYYVQTAISGDVKQPKPKDSMGYVAKQKITEQGSEPDGPNPVEYWPTPPHNTPVQVVADAPGFPPKEYKYPLEYKTNFYLEVVSKKDKKVKAQIWYNVVIIATGPGQVKENEGPQLIDMKLSP